MYLELHNLLPSKTRSAIEAKNNTLINYLTIPNNFDVSDSTKVVTFPVSCDCELRGERIRYVFGCVRAATLVMRRLRGFRVECSLPGAKERASRPFLKVKGEKLQGQTTTYCQESPSHDARQECQSC